MASSFGGTVKLTGESEYRKALKDITSDLRLMSSELKLTTTQFSSGDKTVKETKSSYDNMNKSVKDQKEKINALREELSKAEKEYGSNNEKVKMFKTQLNNAEAQLTQMENATDKSTKELKNMKQGFDDAGGGAVKFGDLLKANVLGDAIVGGIKALGSAMKELGKAFVDVGKQALDSYADYEQLEGGIQKLYGDSTQKVIENANNAYKNTGMSANQYLSSATAFSAKLLNDFSGDANKAADYADKAMQQIADNANTYGKYTTEELTGVYQNLAKGTYTTLDNLNLGYSGSKKGMEDLIADAEKWSGKKFELGNFADMVDAIQVVQDHLNITGTTANEASKTISGSVNSMKSAWENLLTGFANGNADLGQLINNLVESVFGKDGEGGVLNNVVPAVEKIVNSVVEALPMILNAITQNLPKLLDAGIKIINSLVTGITNNMPTIMSAIMQILNALITTILENLPMILQAGITIIVELVKGIAQSLPTLIPAMVDAVITMVDTLIDNIDLIIDAALQLIIGLTNGLIKALPKLIEKAPEIIAKLVAALLKPDMLSKLISSGITLTLELGKGLIKAIPQMIAMLPKIISEIVKELKKVIKETDWLKLGKDMLKGILDGMLDFGSVVKDTVAKVGKKITNGIKDFFGIHSPSTLFKNEVGKNLALGLGEGFSDTMKDVTKDMTGAIPTEFDTNINSNYNGGSSSYDMYLSAFKEALKDVKVVMNNREMGTFVVDTMEKVVYS